MHLDTEEDTNPKNIEDIEDAKEDRHTDQHQPQSEDLSHKSSRGEGIKKSDVICTNPNVDSRKLEENDQPNKNHMDSDSESALVIDTDSENEVSYWF